MNPIQNIFHGAQEDGLEFPDWSGCCRIAPARLARKSCDGTTNCSPCCRAEHNFPRDPKQPFGVDCVYSTERQVFPAKDGTVCATREPGERLRLDCRTGYGTASFVTGAFGFAAAAQVVKKISGAT